MDKNAKAGKPFFIQLSWNALHAAENANKATLAKYEKRPDARNPKHVAVAAITENLDTGVGQVMQAIDRLGLSKNTYLIYMSDNGAGGGGRGGLNGGKGGVWEGGIRVPLIVRGPGVTANSWCHTRVVGFDWFPTFCEWGGVAPQSLPNGIEGGNIASLLANGGEGQVQRPREELVFHFPHYQGDSPHSAILLGNLKLMKFYEDNRLLLFDLSKDISERNDLAAQMPAEAERLRKRLESYLTAINAQLPTFNPQYDPSRPAEPMQKKGGKGKGSEKRKAAP
jgi:arylsulfatase A-like enzyme